MEPLGLQNRAKIDPSRVKSPLDTSFFQKLEFSRNIGRRSVWSVSRVPRQHPKRTKIDPRQLEDDLRNLCFLSSFLSSILIPLWRYQGFILVPFWIPKKHPTAVDQPTPNLLKPPQRSMSVPDGFKMAQDAPKNPRRSSQDPHMTSKTLQKISKIVSPNLPLRPRNVILHFSCILFSHPFSHLKFDQLNTTQLNSCALTFCPFAASILEPFGLQNRAKIDPSRVKSPLDTSFFQKLEFSRNIGRRSVWSVSRVPRQHPKRTKIDPRQLEDNLRNLCFSSSFLSSILIPKKSIRASSWVPLGPPKSTRPRRGN